MLTDAVSEINDDLKGDNTASNNASYHTANESKICTFFSKYKNCRYGRNCRFKHIHQSEEPLLFTPEKNRYVGNYDRTFFSNSRSMERTTVKNISDKKLTSTSIVCRYFKAGNCAKGDHCLYHHFSENNEVSNNSACSTVKMRRVPNCHYFKKGNCRQGEDCKFYHFPKHEQNAAKNIEEKPKEIETTSDTNSEKLKKDTDPLINQEITSMTVSLNMNENNAVSKNQDQNNKFLHGKKLYDRSNLCNDDLTKLRDVEIAQVKKRYPQHTISEEQSILFTFEPSDPDWPFDLKSFDLEVNFPVKYPVEACKIIVASSSYNIPDILVRHINRSIEDFIEKRFEDVKNSFHTELLFRPFLKWFDRNLEDIFVCGLRKVKRDIEATKDGIEYVPVENLFSSSNVSNNSEFISIEAPKENILGSSECQTKSSNGNEAKKFINSSTLLDNTALKQGIKVIFNGLELVEGIATFTCSKLSLTVQCIRCKTSCNIKSYSEKSTSAKCLKCNKVIECSFSPSMMHQFSNVAGNVHVIECQVVDINLVDSCFVLDCLNCTKIITIDGLQYGQKQKRWCTSCNEKLIFSIESVKLQATSSTFIAAKSGAVKKVEKKKDPLFKEGEPLPDNGTCKHYKKSFRWLRFPCCGRLYPCDICHDEKENDHEMKFASRMICGFCSKEQAYSKDKPCSSCSGSMTAKSGAHWEGGKGCRNKIKMARDDKHKYSGTSKTVSKKAQSLKTGKK